MRRMIELVNCCSFDMFAIVYVPSSTVRLECYYAPPLCERAMECEMGPGAGVTGTGKRCKRQFRAFFFPLDPDRHQATKGMVPINFKNSSDGGFFEMAFCSAFSAPVAAFSQLEETTFRGNQPIRRLEDMLKKMVGFLELLLPHVTSRPWVEIPWEILIGGCLRYGVL